MVQSGAGRAGSGHRGGKERSELRGRGCGCRQVLERSGLGKYFVHSTGHGLGLEIHEDPRIARGQKKRLEPGNVITIEPGIYIEDVGGIRIEDDVVVHESRIEVLTRPTRDLIEI